MNRNHSIDDLFGSLSANLIKGYEVTNGVNLVETNEEYKEALSKDPDAMERKFLKIMLAVWAVSLIVSFTIYIRYDKLTLSFLVLIAIMAPFLAYLRLVVEKKNLKIMETISRCAVILSQFRAAVEGLNILNKKHMHTELSVREELIKCAARKLDTEKNLDAACAQGRQRLSDIMQLGSLIEECENQFSSTIMFSRKFGLEFKRGELFAAAEKYNSDDCRLARERHARWHC